MKISGKIALMASLLSLATFSTTSLAMDRSPYYYPPTTAGDDTWDTVSARSLGWDVNALNEAIAYAAEQDSTAFIILHKGKIVSENYWDGWTLHTTDKIYSAHKAISALAFGIMQEQGLVHRDQFVSDYLTNWSRATSAQEAAIQIKHLQTMSSGLGERLLFGTTYYIDDPDTLWKYNTLAYHMMNKIMELQSPQDNYHGYLKDNIYDVIGMHDVTPDGLKTSYQSARDMARFGLMMLGNGTWQGRDVIVDKSYLSTMTATSQNFNDAYGLLTWLNGKSSYKVPGDTTIYTGALFPDAPADLYAALGKDDKKIYMVPSLDLIVVRHGPAAPDGGTFAASDFDNYLWQKLCLAMSCNRNRDLD